MLTIKLRIGISVLLVYYSTFYLVTGHDWPDCNGGNFDFGEGFPAGCVSSAGDLCMVQSEECRAVLCANLALVKETMDSCTYECAFAPWQAASCDCLKYSMPQCFTLGASSPPSSQPSCSRRPVAPAWAPESARATEYWGGRFSVPGVSALQVVYRAGERRNSRAEEDEESLCRRGPCRQGACHFRDSCYFVGTAELDEISSEQTREDPDYSEFCGNDTWAVEVNTMLERELVFSLLGESSTGDTWVVWTGGKVLANSTEGIWIDSGETIDHQIFDASQFYEPETFDRYLTIQIDECGDANFTLVRDSQPVTAVLCETFPSGDISSTPAPTTVPPCGCNGNGSYEEKWCCPAGLCLLRCPLSDREDQFASWMCDGSSFSTPLPDYTNCSSDWLNNTYVDASYEEVLVILTDNVNNQSVYGNEMSQVLDLTTEAMEKLIKEQSNVPDPNLPAQLEQRERAMANMTEIVYRLTDVSFHGQWSVLNQTERMVLGVSIQATLEELGFATTDLARRIGSDYGFTAGEGANFTDVQFVVRSEGDRGPVLRFPMAQWTGSYIELLDYPDLIGEGETSVGIEAIGNTFTRKQANFAFPNTRNGADPDKLFNSEMLSLSLRGPDGKPITSFPSRAIKVVLAHEIAAYGSPRAEEPCDKCARDHEFAVRGSAYCAFWNPRGGPDGAGAWDSSGCEIKYSNRTHTVCACNHLSSFAILMDIKRCVGYNLIGTYILSVVCSILSMVSLAVTFCVLQFVKELQGLRTSIGKNLCFCLFIAHFLSLILVDEDMTCLNNAVPTAPIAGGCVAVGALTHYMFLAAFMWMGIEGFHLYRLVVHVFESGRNLKLPYMTVAYGIPAIIVGLTLIMGVIMNERVAPYGDNRICWLSTPGYIWAFIAPVILISAANLGVLVLTMRVAMSASQQRNEASVKKIRMWLRGWFSLASILGVTWLFGFVYLLIDKDLEYVYILLTGLQGVFILLAKVVLNKPVKRALRRSIERSPLLSRFYSSLASPVESRSNNWSVVAAAAAAADTAELSKHVAYHSPCANVAQITWKKTLVLDEPDASLSFPLPYIRSSSTKRAAEERDSAVFSDSGAFTDSGAFSSSSSTSFWDYKSLRVPTLRLSRAADVFSGTQGEVPICSISPAPPREAEEAVDVLYGRINKVPARLPELAETPHAEEQISPGQLGFDDMY